MKFSFHKVNATDIDGKVMPDLNIHKTLANAIFRTAKDLDLVSIAQIMNKGEEVNLNEAQINEVKVVINNEVTGFFAFVKKALLDYIEETQKK